ncbi:MAG: molybdopterin-dependent oxidoreductase [Reichenbachiella sp.]
MPTSRRDFIKITSLSLGGLAVGGGSIISSLSSEALGLSAASKAATTATYCEICFWKCAGWVHTNDEGDIQKITGHDDDPHCNGRLCPRGTGGVGMYNDPDRLKTPLIRETVNGKQTFREASWDEALDLAASKLKKIAADHGPEHVALFTHGSGGSYFGDLLKGFGSDAITAPSFAQCRGPREVAFLATFGEIIGSPERTDIRDTDCLVLIGSHIGENMHNGQVQEMSMAIDRGATIITVDPRFSTAASKSTHWLPIKPATDMALLLAWMHVIINEEWYDKKYVAQYCYGFEELKAHVQPFTPEWAYGITTLKPDQIRKTAKEMANASPAVIIHPGRHVTWYGDDTQRLRAVAILNALLGSWGKRGGFYYPEKAPLKSYPKPPFPVAKKSWREAIPGNYDLAHETLANGLCDASVPGIGRNAFYKGWIVNGTNLIMTLPDQKKTLEAIQNLDFLMVVDTMPMEITGYADIILPECTYLERYDNIRNSGHREPNLALRMPAVAPMYDTKPAWWMAKELANRLNIGEYFPWKNIEAKLDYELKMAGSSLKEMKKLGVKKFKRPYDDLYIKEGEEIDWNTNTGKIELYSTELAAQGFDPMPVYKEHEQPQPGFYRLIYGRAPMHTFSRTTNNPNLAALMDENTCWINPKVAKEWEVKNDQYIWLKNQDDVISDFAIKVRVTERIRHDSIYMVHGFGHTDKKLKTSFGKGVSDTQLITNVKLDPIMGGTGMRANFVTFLTEDPHLKGKEVEA